VTPPAGAIVCRPGLPLSPVDGSLTATNWNDPNMKKINRKLLLILTAAVVVLGGGLFFLHYLQSGRIASALLWQARRAEANGDLKKTVHFLKRYLEFEPNDFKERACLGRTLADPRLAKTGADREQAFFVLEQVVSRDPDRLDLRRLLGRIAIELQQYDRARPHLDILAQRCPRDGEVQLLLGQWHEGQEQYPKAEPCYRRAVQACPQEPDYALRLAELLRLHLGKTEEARAVVAEARKRSPDHVALILKEAELAPASQRARARADLLAGLKGHPREPKLYLALARLEVLADHRDRAERCLRDGLRSVPVGDRLELQWTLAHLLLDCNRPADAEREIAPLRKASLAPGAVDYLLARIDISRGRWARAARSLERIRPKLERSPELAAQLDLYLGQCYEQLEDPIRRLGAYQQATAHDPQSTSARLRLAAAHWAMGHLDLALKEYREAARLPDAAITADAWAQYVRLLIARGQQQSDVDWKEVEAALKKAETSHPGALELVLLHADVLIARNRPEEAWDFLFAAKTNRPEEVTLRGALITLAQSRGQLDRALLVLEEAERDLPNRVELILARARYLLIVKGSGAKEALRKLAEQKDKLSETDQARLFTGLAEASYSAGNVTEAARFLARAADLPVSKNDLRLQLRLFDLCLQAEDDAALGRVVAQMRRIEGEQGTWWQFATASRLVWQARQAGADTKRLLQEADRLLDRVRVQRPQWSAVFLAKAEIAELRGSAADARTYYNLAMEGGESNRAVIHQLVQLGQALADKGERSLEAEQKLRLAVELDNSAPEAWVALVRYLAATDRLKEAEATLAKADRRLNDRLALAQCQEAVGRLELAEKQYLRVLGERPYEAVVLRAVATFYMRNNLARAAEPHLRKLIAANIQKTDADVAWARRALAMVLADGRDYKRYLEALALVGLSVDGSGRIAEADVSVPAERDEIQRARARVLASHPGRLFRARAIQLLEDQSRRRPLLPDDQLLLANLYESTGKEGWAKARETLAGLVAAQGRNPAYLAHFARSLLDHGDVAEAARLAARLRDLAKARGLQPGAFGSIEIEARALELGGKGGQALAMLKAYAAANKTQPAAILAYAACLGRLNRLDDALDQCARAAKIGWPVPAIGSSLALLRAAQPTLEQCARVETMLREALEDKPEKPTAVVLRLQHAELHDLRGRYDEAETLYRKVLADDENNVMALNNLAWLLAQRKGRGDEALALIQKAIDRLGPRAELLDTQAVVHLARQRSDLAIADLQKATLEAPSATRYFNLARAHHMARNAAAALDAFRKAKALGLKPERLHPVERVAYTKIASDLEQR
jgi:tetratricopeptide (TPR) repeat protein